MRSEGEIRRLTELLEQHRAALLALPGVVGVGVGSRSMLTTHGDLVIQVFVVSDTAALTVRRHAVSIVGSEDVEVFVSGQVEPLDS